MFYRKILALLGFVVLANFWFFQTIGNLGVGLFLALVFGLIAVAYPWKREMLVLAIGLAGSVFVLGWRANFDIRIVFLLVTVGIVGLATYISTTKRIIGWSLSELLVWPLANAKRYLAGLVATWPQFKQELKLPVPWAIGRGLILAIPIVYVLVLLLSKADPIFAKQVSNLFSWFTGELKTRIMLSLALASVTVPLLFIPIQQQTGLRLRRLPLAKEFTVVMGLVAIVIAAFLVIEWPYVFASVPKETELQKFGINTYSEYVQEGFNWFLGATVFIFGLVWLGLLMRAWRIAQIAVLGGFFVFLISIFRRIWLYQTYHGMTLVRAYGGFFVLTIALFTTTLLLRHVWRKPWVYLEMVWVGLLLILLGTVNVENYIATVSPPTVNGRVDYVYLSRMSADGYKGWLKAYTYAEETLNKPDPSAQEVAYAGMVVRQLMKRYDELVWQYDTPTEKEDYFKAAVDYEKLQVIEAQRMVETALEGSKNNTRVNQIKQSLEQYQGRLAAKPNELVLDFYLPYLSFRPSAYIDFNDEECRNFGICPNSFFSVYKVKEYSFKRNKLDILFTYSWSKQQASALMWEDMFNKLLDLQSKFFGHYKRLAKENATYEHDISLNTPFLQPL